MSDLHDLELTLRSRIPLVIIETREESRVLDLLRRVGSRLGVPIFTWSVTEGLLRLEAGFEPRRDLQPPESVLRHIKVLDQAGVFVLLDFHPYLDDPVRLRLLKEIALDHPRAPRTVVLVSHVLPTPDELRHHTARFELSLPDAQGIMAIVNEVAQDWRRNHPGQVVSSTRDALKGLVRHFRGLTAADVRRLARTAIFDDGAITADDVPAVTQAKYALLGGEGILYFEYDTAQLADVGGLRALKRWLAQRRAAFLGRGDPQRLTPPKGMLLLGVQGSGKSLAAKAVAGSWGVPLLRLDFGTLHNKYFGESERNLREALRTAGAMAPCVLWLDEVEKGIATDQDDGGPGRRILGTLLTWMAEHRGGVFLVATANDIAALPPELIRKGRLDEVFFVDLPAADVRETIFAIHLRRRALDSAHLDLPALAAASEGFSGAEIEQAVVSALYANDGAGPTTDHLLAELARTQPLSVVMAERVQALRLWAAGRTVPAD